MDEEKKKEIILEAILEYQVSGCVNDFDENDFKQEGVGIEWSDHVAGTLITGIGGIFLGMPKPFSRLGIRPNDPEDILKINMFWDFNQLEDKWKYDKFNIPCWKYRNEKRHVFVRGLMPRLNKPFLHIILEDCLDKIDCLEITEKDLEEMD